MGDGAGHKFIGGGDDEKFLPGITMDYSAGEARTVSMNGVPAANVPITVGGFDHKGY
mgnify:CR=1 FL=1